MDLQDWKWTIINWINCVSSKNVNDITDLEDGEVFSTLISELRTEKGPNLKKGKSPFRHVKNFLRGAYPAFVIFDSLNVFTHEEALFVGSLLLHYCCVVCKDTNTKYQEKMSNLEGSCQINIVKYLENMMKENTITRETITSSVPLTDIHCSSSTSISPSTPNQEKFAVQLQRLKEQLKSSQSEIFFLEESVKTATEKGDQLALERDKLLAENKSLRADLATLDSENNPADIIYQKPEVDLQLQNELTAKSELITLLQNDIEVLQTEKEKLETKMISMEKDLQLLEEKSLELEYNNASLQKELENRDMDYQQLSDICNEQNLTIEQLKEIKQIDQSVDSIDLSMSQLPPEVQSRFTENLAQSVVDVQLRETEEQVRLLQESLEEAKAEHQKQKEILQAELEKSVKTIKDKDDKIQITEKTLSDTNMELKTSMHKIEELEKLNTEVVDRIASTEAALADRIQHLQTIIGEDLCPVLTIDDSVILLKNIVTKVQSTTDLNNQLNNDVIVLETELGKTSEHVIRLQELNAICEADKENISLELQNSKKQVEELLYLNEQFEADIVQLTLIRNEQEKHLEELNIMKLAFEQQQQCNELEIQELNKVISGKNIAISDLESAKLILIEKCNDNNLQLTELTTSLNNKSTEIKQLLEEKQELAEAHSKLHNEFQEAKLVYDTRFDDLIILQESAKKEIQELTEIIAELNKEINKVMTEKSELIQQHATEKDGILEEVAESRQKIVELKASNSRLESNLEILTKNNKSYENTIQNLQIANNDFIEFKKKSETNMQEYVRQTELFSKELNNKVKIYENKISELMSDISVLSNKLTKCECEKNAISLDIERHLENSILLEQNLKASISECNLLAGNLKKAEFELEKAQQQQNSMVEAKNEEIMKLEQSMDSFQNTINKLNIELASKNNMNENVLKRVSDLEGNKDEIQEIVVALQNECIQNEKLLEDLQHEKDDLINEHSRVMYEKDQQINVYKKDIEEIRKQLSKERNLSQELTSKIDHNNEQILKLEQNNSDLSLKIENLTSIISIKDKNILELEQSCEHYADRLNSASIQIEEQSSKIELLNSEITEIQGELNSKTSVCQNLVKEMNVIEGKNNELSAELTATLQELKNIRKSYEDKIEENHELLQKTEQNIALCQEQYAQDNEDLNKKYKELLINSENSTKELQSQIAELIENNQIQKAKRLELEDLLQTEKCEKENLSSLISTFENDRCFIQESHDKLQSTILAINDIFKAVENHTDLEMQSSNVKLPPKLSTANLFSTNISQINSDLKSIQNHLSIFIESYKLLQNISKEKFELQNKYDSLKLGSEQKVLEHEHKIQEMQLCNKTLNLRNQHLKEFVQTTKEFCRDNLEMETLMRTAFSDLQEKLDKAEQLKIEDLKSSKEELRAQIDKLVELKNNTKTNFTELAELNCSLDKKLKAVSKRRSIKYTDALRKKEELEKHFNRLSNHNITLIEKIVSQLLSLMDESKEIANVDITDIVNTIQFILNDAKIIKEQCVVLDNSIKDFIEDTSSSHETDYSNDQIEVYTPISSTPSGYVSRKINQKAIHTHFEINPKYESLKSDYENLSISHDSLNKELSELKLKFNCVQKELLEISEMQKHEEIINENLKLQKQISGLFKQVEDQSNELITVRKVNEDLKKEVDLIDKKYSMAKIKYLEYDEIKSKHIESLKRQLADSSDIDEKVEQKVKQLRNEYEGKLEKMKNKMKELYNNEMAKLDKKVQEEKSGLEELCAKYTEKIKSFESHVARLSKELFEMGEKYVAEQNENIALKNEIRKFQLQSVRNRATGTLANGPVDLPENERSRRGTFPRTYKGNRNADPGFVDVIEETVTTTKRCVKPLSSVGSNIYMEDEDEVFNNTYLMDLQAGRCEVPGRRASIRSCENLSSSNDDSGVKRLSELKWRNSMCPPHLRSSYATETQLEEFRENEVRVLDTSSAQLLPSDLGKATSSRFTKDRSAGTSYRKPGPPTPSKNGGRNSIGGRNSLINNELPRDVLKERNDIKSNGAVKKAKATTPNRLKAMFMGSKTGLGTDENESTSPKKRLSLFKRPRS